ncbi:MAG TPA: diacylglycerol kinase family protein [Methylomirabilota bacterium]|nr:diacylglycerol kinase family protein [Methylomirabilota bacterium]
MIIVNPVAGRPATRDGRDRAALAAGALGRAGIRGAVHLTRGRGHAAELARVAVAGGASLLCAWGGDGTVNEVARACVGGAVSLGIVPAGSGNGLARELGLPRDPSRALDVALGGRERTIDAGEVDGQLFVNLAGLGLDATVAACYDQRGPRRRGGWPYVAISVRELFRYRPGEYAIRLDDGEPWRGPALLVVCANARQYGGGAVIAPAARPDDGRLDLVVVGPRPPLATLVAARHLFRGTLPRAAGVRTATFSVAEIRGPAPLAFHVDGEPGQGGSALTVRVRPGALRVRVP